MNIKLKSKLQVHLLMVVAVGLAASSFPIGALITNELSPAILMFIRFSVATVLFAPFVIFKYGIKLPGKQRIIHYVLLSIPLVIFFWCMFESLRYTSVLNTGALNTTVPAMTAVYAYFINKETSGKSRTIGLLLGTAGALWIVFRGDVNALLSLQLNYGDFIFIVGCLCLGLYNPLVKRFYKGEPMVVITFWVLFFSSILLLIVSGWELGQVEWGQIDSNVYIAIFYLAFFATLITFYLINYCTIKLGPTKVAAYSFLTPMFVITMSLIIGLEQFEYITIPGLLLIIVGMFFIQKGANKIRS